MKPEAPFFFVLVRKMRGSRCFNSVQASVIRSVTSHERTYMIQPIKAGLGIRILVIDSHLGSCGNETIVYRYSPVPRPYRCLTTT